MLASVKSRAPEPLEAPGRKSGQLAGVHVTELAVCEKTIILCGGCKHRFDWKRYGYFCEKNLPVAGRCDGCDDLINPKTLFIHEQYLGQTWTPRKAR